MGDAEPLLLVHDKQTEILEAHVLGQEAVSADDHIYLADRQVVEDGLRFLLRSKPADHLDHHRKARESIAQRLQVLKGEHGRGRQERDLFAVHDSFERRPHGDLGLAIANITAQQAIHRRRRFHVTLDVPYGRRLIDGQLVRKRALEFLLPVRIRREGVAWYRLPLGVQLQQLLGHVAHRFLDARLGFFPRRPTEAVEGWTGSACVLLNEIEALDGDEQLVVAVIAQLEKFLQTSTRSAARLRARGELLQSDELANPMIDMDHEVANFEIAQVRKKRLREAASLLRGRTFLFENIGLGVDLKRRVAKAESS